MPRTRDKLQPVNLCVGNSICFVVNIELFMSAADSILCWLKHSFDPYFFKDDPSQWWPLCPVFERRRGKNNMPGSVYPYRYCSEPVAGECIQRVLILLVTPERIAACLPRLPESTVNGREY